MFFVFHSQTFVLSYCFRQLISGQFVTIRGFLKSRLPDQTAMAVYLLSHFTDILDARKQIQIKSLTKVDAISFSIAETTPSSVTVDGFIDASFQIKRGTLERWLLHDSISHIDWRQVVGDRTCVYWELGDHAVGHLLPFSSCGLCSLRECRWYT